MRRLAPDSPTSQRRSRAGARTGGTMSAPRESTQVGGLVLPAAAAQRLRGPPTGRVRGQPLPSAGQRRGGEGLRMTPRSSKPAILRRRASASTSFVLGSAASGSASGRSKLTPPRSGATSGLSRNNRAQSMSGHRTVGRVETQPPSNPGRSNFSAGSRPRSNRTGCMACLPRSLEGPAWDQSWCEVQWTGVGGGGWRGPERDC
jgi:hypothetical protein